MVVAVAGLTDSLLLLAPMTYDIRHIRRDRTEEEEEEEKEEEEEEEEEAEGNGGLNEWERSVRKGKEYTNDS